MAARSASCCLRMSAYAASRWLAALSRDARAASRARTAFSSSCSVEGCVSEGGWQQLLPGFKRAPDRDCGGPRRAALLPGHRPTHLLQDRLVLLEFLDGALWGCARGGRGAEAGVGVRRPESGAAARRSRPCSALASMHPAGSSGGCLVALMPTCVCRLALDDPHAAFQLSELRHGARVVCEPRTAEEGRETVGRLSMNEQGPRRGGISEGRRSAPTARRAARAVAVSCRCRPAAHRPHAAHPWLCRRSK